MLLFQPPPFTRYDLNFTIAGIPVRVHPLFWLVTVLFGLSSGSLLHMLVWVPVVFVSILLHELGHALAFRRFGQPSQVILHMGGGLTMPESVWWGTRTASVGLRPGQEMLVSLAGPGAGFLLAGLVLAAAAAAGGSVSLFYLLWIIPIPEVSLPSVGWLGNTILHDLMWVNIFWGLVNLAPVRPLDGGNLTRILLVGVDPWDGARKSLYVSLAAGIIIAVTSLLFLGQIFLAVLFGVLAYQSYLLLRQQVSGY